MGRHHPCWGEGRTGSRKKSNCDADKTKALEEWELQSGMQSASEEGGLLTWCNYQREDSVESCPIFPTARGTDASVSNWGMDLDGAERFHYRVESRRKEQVPLFTPKSNPPTPKICAVCF